MFFVTGALATARANEGLEPEDIYLSGWYMDGENIAQLPAPKPKDCLKSCQNRPDCTFGIFHPTNRTCELKRNSSFISRAVGPILVTTSFKSFSRVPSIEVRSSVASDFGNLDGVAHFVGDEDICRKLCSLQAQCNAAMFYDGRVKAVHDLDRNRCVLRQILNNLRVTHYDIPEMSVAFIA